MAYLSFAAEAAFLQRQASTDLKAFTSEVLSERELIQGCLRGDRRCEEELYRTHARRMYGVCLRYARHELEAQDMLQEGFIKVYEKLKDFRMEGSLEGWIRRIMVHTAINHYRKRSFQMEQLGLDRTPERAVGASAMETLGEKELLAMVAALPEGYRMVFNLYAIEGFDHAEIASMLGCGESTSRSQLSKARRMLQEKINETKEHVHAGRTSHR